MSYKIRGVGDEWAGWAFVHQVFDDPNVRKITWFSDSQISYYLPVCPPIFWLFPTPLWGVEDEWARWAFNHPVFDDPKITKITWLSDSQVSYYSPVCAPIFWLFPTPLWGVEDGWAGLALVFGFPKVTKITWDTDILVSIYCFSKITWLSDSQIS